ncbi:MAG TPA: zf-TFIIB domain-containing protein [Candidatus Thermoplasmatota archaeon]|nr:zf-TFIIB domain-containing protein [Candidatus Thermoplasmatota archaeon]
MQHLARLCPRDRTPLHEQRAGRVNVDLCPQCKGTFLDGIELRRIVGDAELALALAEKQGAAAAEACKCPACGAAMYLDEVDGIALDHCATCLGVWLDAGEVERVAARTLAGVAKARAPKLDAVLRDVASATR